MSVKKYGVFIAYSAVVDLRREGLGRHLAAFVRGAAGRDDIRLVLAYPWWLQGALESLFEEEGISFSSFEALNTKKNPILLSCYNFLRRWKKRRRKEEGRHSKLFDLFNRMRSKSLRGLVSARGITGFVCYGGACCLIFGLPALGYFVKNVLCGMKFFRKNRLLSFVKNKFFLSHEELKKDRLVSHLYSMMEEGELSKLVDLVNSRDDVQAWYCPTSFWPHFNNVQKPKLTCLPDVVLSDFPIKFAELNSRFPISYDRVKTTLLGGEHFVTYSEYVKWHTLVGKFAHSPEKVHVIRHGASVLNEYLTVDAGENSLAATESFSRSLMLSALKKSPLKYGREFQNPDVEFLFYASQFRPNKNIYTLLQAFRLLLRSHYRQIKLVLTGTTEALPELDELIRNLELENDVLCLHGLTTQELAACYNKAQLSVNPTLFEGGFPFTFTESLSVGTPVVMSRIPVVTECITDATLDNVMLFDPYDSVDMANRILWALDNREALFEMQEPLYKNMIQRSWKHVVTDHFEVLDQIGIERC
ncbi:glycosyltransferase [Halodesulfovibrio aestuarii]|uniref:glycosyltransferase n=1 Tax=Halodesulfovibrio aestuarii TaxID=126333 RepID=UPI003D3435E1